VEPEREPILTVTDVSRTFGGVHAVDHASFLVGAASITGLIGPNGAGKSTICNVIAGLLAPDKGSVRYAGREVAGRSPHELARMGLLRTFQASSEFGRLTVTENLLVAGRAERGATLRGALLGQRYWGAEERANLERARILLEEFGLLPIADQRAGELSGGQKRLVEITRAIMAAPRLLLLDEPMAGVHPSMVESVIAAIERLHEEGISILMVEHDLNVIERVCDHVVVMANGTVIAAGVMEELRQNELVVDAYFHG
jgi:ABC-type branched-subunit amino acid transport system ATPase component